jgi:NADPH-dependent 2,4-dienoyl-CoA reductase/sulfur reductase-like enzyme
MTKYGQSLWVDVFPRSRVPAYPRHRGHLDADVVIVGGGLTGCATAYACAAAGVKAVLIEASRI